MIIRHSDLKKSKKNDISASLQRGKRNAHKLSSNAKMANTIKSAFLIFAAISLIISIAALSYGLIKPKIDKLKKESPKTELKSGEYQMIYNHDTKKYEIDL